MPSPAAFPVVLTEHLTGRNVGWGWSYLGSRFPRIQFVRVGKAWQLKVRVDRVWVERFTLSGSQKR